MYRIELWMPLDGQHKLVFVNVADCLDKRVVRARRFDLQARTESFDSLVMNRDYPATYRLNICENTAGGTVDRVNIFFLNRTVEMLLKSIRLKIRIALASIVNVQKLKTTTNS